MNSGQKKHNISLSIPKADKNQTTLTGTTAMPGNAIGIARVLLEKKKIPTLQKGEILITSMTTPDFLPAMEKAAAFITDEGGVTCHAAIVAREIGKPCVIGTQFATQLIQTGDTIEVNATKGIIHIVKKHLA